MDSQKGLIKNKIQMIYSSYTCHNAELITKVANLYFKDGYRIADVTYGKGAFWRNIDIKKYDFFASDLLTTPDTPYDFRQLPYENNYFDVIVFDPPYVHNPGKLLVNDNYKNAETTKGFYHDDIIKLYKDGIRESHRVLKNTGFMLVKCKDEIESSQQRMSHIEIYNIALHLEMGIQDLFVVTQKVNPVVQHKKQKHARKNHSYLWIFKK